MDIINAKIMTMEEGSIFVTLFTGFLIGLSNGINVLVARFYGARHADDVERYAD